MKVFVKILLFPLVKSKNGKHPLDNVHQIIINFLIHCAVHAGISKVYIFPFSNYHLSCARNNNNIHTCATSQQNNKLMVFDIHVLMFNFVMQCHVNNHCYGVHACSKHCFQQFALKT